MQFTTTQNDLNQALQFVASAIDGKSTLPVLNNVLIQAEAGRVVISGTNAEVEKRITIPAKVEQDGSITVPAKKFQDFAKNADPQKDIKLTVANNKATVQSGRSRWQLVTIPASEYPEFMQVKGSEPVSVDVNKLIDGIKRCGSAMGVNDVRYYLNGMLLDVKPGSVTLVATDGHRMSMYALDTDAQIDRQAIVPRQTVLDINKMISRAIDATIELGVDNIKVTVGNMEMYSKLIDGKFPNYKAVIPSDLPVSAEMNTEEFRSAVRRTLPLTNQYGAMLFAFADGQLVMNATNQQHEEATEDIPAAFTSPVEIGFNGNYTMDMLNSVTSETMTLQMKDGNSSARVDDGDYTAVLMPIRF